MGYYVLLFAAMFLFLLPAKQRGGESMLGFFLTASGVCLGLVLAYAIIALVLELLFYRHPKEDDLPKGCLFVPYKVIFILGLLIAAAVFYADESYSWSLGTTAAAFMIWIEFENPWE